MSQFNCTCFKCTINQISGLHSLEEPIRKITRNAGVDGSIVVEKVKEKEGAWRWSAQTETYEDLIKAGIMGPTKVARRKTPGQKGCSRYGQPRWNGRHGRYGRYGRHGLLSPAFIRSYKKGSAETPGPFSLGGGRDPVRRDRNSDGPLG